MDRSRADQKLVQRPPCSGVTDGAGWQESTTQCQRSSTQTVHFSAAVHIADLWHKIVQVVGFLVVQTLLLVHPRFSPLYDARLRDRI